VPFGEYAELTRRGVPRTGQPSYGGLIATGGGVIFATGTIDAHVRALDAATGEELWSHQLPAAGSAPPTTYAIDGRQYVAVVATGGRFHGFDERASRIVAFALPEEEGR
jgi:quinoprotein glucose dehydrogenase